MLSATMLDGLLHYAHIVQIGGEIYRLKDKRKVGQTGHVQVRRRLRSERFRSLDPKKNCERQVVDQV
jgi:hypothetical protein